MSSSAGEPADEAVLWGRGKGDTQQQQPILTDTVLLVSLLRLLHCDAAAANSPHPSPSFS